MLVFCFKSFCHWCSLFVIESNGTFGVGIFGLSICTHSV